MANHPKFSGLKNHFMVLMNSVGQEFGQNTVGMMCEASAGKSQRVGVI